MKQWFDICKNNYYLGSLENSMYLQHNADDAQNVLEGKPQLSSSHVCVCVCFVQHVTVVYNSLPLGLVSASFKKDKNKTVQLCWRDTSYEGRARFWPVAWFALTLSSIGCAPDFSYTVSALIAEPHALPCARGAITKMPRWFCPSLLSHTKNCWTCSRVPLLATGLDETNDKEFSFKTTKRVVIDNVTTHLYAYGRPSRCPFSHNQIFVCLCAQTKEETKISNSTRCSSSRRSHHTSISIRISLLTRPQ